MNRRIISVLIVFLLASVTIPAATAVETPEVYYKLHDMCLCGAHADLGRIPFATFGIGYEGRVVDDAKDKWILFIHAGAATKKIIITPETPTQKLMLIWDFVNAVKECKAESDQIPPNLLMALLTGSLGSGGMISGTLYDNAPITSGGVLSVTESVEQIRQAVTHFNNAKNAQKNAELLFSEVI